MKRTVIAPSFGFADGSSPAERGRGTARSAVEAATANSAYSAAPFTMLRLVPLPRRCATEEDPASPAEADHGASR